MAGAHRVSAAQSSRINSGLRRVPPLVGLRPDGRQKCSIPEGDAQSLPARGQGDFTNLRYLNSFYVI